MRGYTLIEMMITIAILGIGVALLLESSSLHAGAVHRARHVEAVTRALDQEMERMRACADRRCLEALVTRTATTAGLSPTSATWARPLVQRGLRAGPDGTVRLEVRAEVPGVLPERTLRALWVKP